MLPQPRSRSAIAATLRRRHRHLPLRPLRRLPPRRPPTRRRRTRLRRVRRRLRPLPPTPRTHRRSATAPFTSSSASMPPGSTPTTCSTSCTASARPTPTPPLAAAVCLDHLLRRSATQQELPRRPLRQPEVRSRRGPRRRTLRPQRDGPAVTRRCHSNSAPSARSPADSRPSSANAPASSTSSTTCSP